MKPQGLQTLIYLDGCDAKDTQEIKNELGFLDGQTTNPTLLSKNSDIRKMLDSGKKFSESELLELYKSEIQRIDSIIGGGSISVEVYADDTSTVEDLVAQGLKFSKWAKNIHVKVPATLIGLGAMNKLLNSGIQVNVTLCFSQEQGAAISALSRGFDNVYVSPFIGRLDDIGQDGMSLVENIYRMYSEQNDHHVRTLAASVRDVSQLVRAIEVGAEIVTASKKVLIEWKDRGFPLKLDQEYQRKGSPIPYQDFPLDEPLNFYNLNHELTSKGQTQFAEDWKSMIE